MSLSNLAAIRARYERLRKGDTSRWKPGVGDNLIRVVSFIHNKMEFLYLESLQHFQVRRYSKQPVECPRALFGGDCAICELIEAAEGAPDDFSPEDLSLISNYQEKSVFYFNVLEKAHPELGCQLWPASGSIARDLLGLVTARDARDNLLYPDMTSPERGIDLNLHNTGAGFDRYSLTVVTTQENDIIKIVRSPLPAEAKPIDLFAFVKAPSYGYTTVVITAATREALPEPASKSRIDVLGEPQPGVAAWSLYLPDSDVKPEEEPVKAKSSAPTTGKASTVKSSPLARFKDKKTIAAPKMREPMLNETDALPWCCGYASDDGQIIPGHWLGENHPACTECVAAEMCKEFTEVESGLENFPEPKPAEEPPPTKPAGRGTSDIIDRLRAKKTKK